MDEGDSRVHNYPPRWNGARRNRQTGAVSLDPLRCGLIPYFGGDPKGGRKPINAKCETCAHCQPLATLSAAYLTVGVPNTETLACLVNGPRWRKAGRLAHFSARVPGAWRSASRFTAGAFGFLILSQ
jgi:hypothetical protein